MSATPRPSPCTTWKLRLLRLLRLSPRQGRRPPCLRFRVFAVWAPVGNEIPPTPLSGRGRDFVHRILESSEPCQALHDSSRPSARRLVLSRILAKVKEKKKRPPVCTDGSCGRDCGMLLRRTAVAVFVVDICLGLVMAVVAGSHLDPLGFVDGLFVEVLLFVAVTRLVGFEMGCDVSIS